MVSAVPVDRSVSVSATTPVTVCTYATASGAHVGQTFVFAVVDVDPVPVVAVVKAFVYGLADSTHTPLAVRAAVVGSYVDAHAYVGTYVVWGHVTIPRSVDAVPAHLPVSALWHVSYAV